MILSPWSSRIFTARWRRALLTAFLALAVQLPAPGKNAVQYGAGLIVNVPFSENEVAQVVQDVVQNGIIRGTKEYNKDEYVGGAVAASTVRVFPAWVEGGKVFYKVREHALDPRNFKNGGDIGTLAVRYVVQAQGDRNCVIHIDAVFVEDFRRTVHPSDGSVESAEYKDIHDRLDAIASRNTQDAEVTREKQRQFAVSSSPQPVPSAKPEIAATESVPAPPVSRPADVQQTPPVPLEDKVKDLRRQVERLVKAPGAALKSAPFHTATTLKSIPTGSEVLIVITSPYWLGVETHDGQHGWILRDELELVP